ncbi:MAG: outer membrane protein assembly factor BamD [Pseudomonadota bacterium]|nr:outer membrane protein assembly factor BamD [Pseudomonadota bacterium]
MRDGKRRIWLVLLSLAFGPALAACASSESKVNKNPDPPEIIYAQADELMNRGKFESAAQKFEEVDREHPYSPQARRAIVMSAFAYYKAGKFAEANTSAQRYSTLHPGTKEAALAQHIVAMSQYDQIKDPARDQSKTKEAVTALRTLVRRYPDSPYAEEAFNRIKIATDILAASEMKVARYYLEQKNFLAAINRYRVVIAEYQTTQHVEEALMRLAEAYMALGIRNEAQTAAAVLGHNFPESQWYKNAYALLKSDGLEPYEDKGSWISRTWRSVKPT